MVISGGGGVSQQGPSEEEKALNEPMKAVAREPDAMNTPLQEHKNTNHGSAGQSITAFGVGVEGGRTESGNFNSFVTMRIHTYTHN